MKYEEIEKLLKEAEAENKKGNLEEMEQLCKSSLALIPIDPFLTKENIKLRARASNLLSRSFWKRGMTKEALTIAKKALALALQSESKEEEGKALLNIGIVKFHLCDYTNALEFDTKALEVFKELGDKDGTSNATRNIGNVYNHLYDYTRALEYYTQSLEICEELGNKHGAANTTVNIGNVYYHLSDYTRALEYYTKALEAYKEVGDKFGVATFTGNIGNVYVKLSDYPRALKYYTKALEASEELIDKQGVARVTGHIGILFANRDFDDYNPKKSENFLLKAIVMSEEIASKLNLFNFHQKLAELYKTQRRWEECQIHFEQYHNIEKEVLSEEARKKAEQLEQQKQAAEREKEIEVAKAAAEARMNATTALLHKVLPESISARMLEGEENISDYFPSISILFADIKGFTAISANMKAIDVVRFLNFVFAEFDRIMKKHGCEKIKTIGDGYMAVAGAPEACDDHAERLAAAALEMQETITMPDDIRQQLPKGASFGIRIGLHTGSAVAGVIGKERFVYDIHSDAVNLASRMESQGEEGKIHVSEDFKEHILARSDLLKDKVQEIEFKSRGIIDIKGKGKMETFFINYLK